MFSANPQWCIAEGGRRTRILGWAGPWVLDERWWDAAAGKPPPRLARVQLQLADGPPLLLGYVAGGWAIEGVYD
jgi:protein ImuB